MRVRTKTWFPRASRRVALCILAVAWPAAAQDPPQEARPLQPGVTVAGTLSADGRDTYVVEAGASAFVHGQVEQIDMDVVVVVRDLDGVELRTFDGPARGPEPFQFETDGEGAYTIEVAPFQGAEGRYEITVAGVEPLAEDPPGRVEQMMRIYDGSNRPGVVVGVVQDGALSFVRAFGMANLTHGVPWEAGTVSNIGSVTKQFTAMALLLLQAEGKLSLDDDIRTHLPELPDFGTPVALRRFLNHTSGYREIYNLLPMTGFQGEDAFAREKAIQVVQRQPDLQAPPNTEWNYNNTGYILLSLVVERVSGQSFSEYMQEHVFGPLGMNDTRVKMVQGEVIPGSAQGYAPDERGGYRATRDLPASAGAGGIYTTVEDLVRWMLNYRDATLGGAEAVSAMATPAVLENGDSTGYGLGLGVGELRGRTIYAHTGGDVAHRAYMGYLPELDGGVIVMSNNASFDLGLGRRIAELFFADDLESAEEDDAAEADEGDAESGMSPERMEAVAGDWVIDVAGTSLDAEITTEDGRLYFQAAGQPRSEARILSDSTVAIVAAQAEFTFHFQPDGATDEATLRQAGAELPMRRTEATELSDEQLQSYVGRYFSEELETFYEVKLDDGKLTVHHLDMDPMPLRHRDGDEFSASVFFLATVAFQRAGNGSVTGFAASNGRTKGVWFRRL